MRSDPFNLDHTNDFNPLIIIASCIQPISPLMFSVLITTFNNTLASSSGDLYCAFNLTTCLSHHNCSTLSCALTYVPLYSRHGQLKLSVSGRTLEAVQP